MTVEWAVFTSLQTDHNEGYQLAATSPGVTESTARELVSWGPGHDALYPFARARGAVGWHQLNDGSFCLARTRGMGAEYSGRGGPRLYTWFFVVPTAVCRRFAFQPFRILQALTAAGYTQPLAAETKRLPPIELVGRTKTVDVDNLKWTCQQCPPLHVATLLAAALQCDRLGIVTDVRPSRLLAALLDLLPPWHRRQMSLTTGLRVSPRRPYHLHVLPHAEKEQRAAARRLPLTRISTLSDPSGRFIPQLGWPLKIYSLLKAQQFEQLAELVGALRDTTEPSLGCLATQPAPTGNAQPPADPVTAPR